MAVEWRYEGGTLALVMNASHEPGRIEAPQMEPIATTGEVTPENGGVRLGPWSAAIAILPAEA